MTDVTFPTIFWVHIIIRPIILLLFISILPSISNARAQKDQYFMLLFDAINVAINILCLFQCVGPREEVEGGAGFGTSAPNHDSQIFCSVSEAFLQIKLLRCCYLQLHKLLVISDSGCEACSLHQI